MSARIHEGYGIGLSSRQRTSRWTLWSVQNGEADSFGGCQFSDGAFHFRCVVPATTSPRFVPYRRWPTGPSNAPSGDCWSQSWRRPRMTPLDLDFASRPPKRETGHSQQPRCQCDSRTVACAKTATRTTPHQRHRHQTERTLNRRTLATTTSIRRPATLHSVATYSRRPTFRPARRERPRPATCKAVRFPIRGATPPNATRPRRGETPIPWT